MAEREQAAQSTYQPPSDASLKEQAIEGLKAWALPEWRSMSPAARNAYAESKVKQTRQLAETLAPQMGLAQAYQQAIRNVIFLTEFD